MEFDARPRETEGIYQNLLRLPPGPRMIAGVVGILAGAVSTVVLWGKGVIFGLALFAVVAGLFLLGSGLAGMMARKKQRAMVDSIQANRDQILRSMIDAKKAGKNPIRLLHENGIHDAGIRSALLEDMDERQKSQ